MESILPNIASNVIQATYLGPMKDIIFLNPTFHITPGSLVKVQLPSGLPVTVLIDTGCHKTILNRKFLQKNLFHFQNFKKVPTQRGSQNKVSKWIGNQNRWFDSHASYHSGLFISIFSFSYYTLQKTLTLYWD